MNKEHISFNRLSDLHDNILSELERDAIMRHLAVCSECSKRYNNLNKLLRMMSYMDLFRIKSEDEFVVKTLKKIKGVRKRVLLFRLLPASAVIAFVIILLGIGYYRGFEDGGKYNHENHQAIRETDEDYEPSQYREINSEYGMDETLSIIRNNNLQKVSISESYIEGNIHIEDYDRLKRECGYTDSFDYNSGFSIRKVNGSGIFEEESLLYSDLNLFSGMIDSRVLRIRINVK
ncbi:MAG: zf-HC2 domain-containing protein [Spirochaetota bacterium]|nr:zf-HC2 domain-containing protein [Spirochaetota bacterium]